VTDRSLVTAVCEDCGRGHRVPSSSRTYTCTHCGGSVHGDVAAATQAVGIPCPECGAENPVGVDHCEECARPLTPAGLAWTASAGEASGKGRVAAAHELRRVRKAVDALHLAHCAGGVVALLFAVLCASWWYRFGSRGWSSLSVVAAIWTVSYGVEATLMLLGGSISRRAPLALALILATVSTAFTVAMALRIDWSGASTLFLCVAVWRIAFSLGLWFLVPPARRLGRLREEHPELYLAQGLEGTRDRAVPADGIARVSERHRHRDAQARKRAYWITAGVAAVLIACGAAARFATRPPSADELIERFEAAWASGDIESVAELFGDDAELRSRQLRSWLEREELEALPLIDFSNRQDRGSRRMLFTLPVELGELELGWARERRRWFLDRIVFPPPAE